MFTWERKIMQSWRTRKHRPWVFLSFTAFVMIMSQTVPSSAYPVFAAPSAPPYTTSRYMKTTDATILYNEGCSLGQQQATQGQTQNPNGMVVVLDFGQPMYSNNTYGTYLFNGTFRSTSSIALAAENFLLGYWNCTPSWPHVRLALGTSNYGSTADFSAHGKAWGSMVNSVGDWIRQKGYGSQEEVAGANDMEMSWNTSTKTRAWADGYAATASWPYYDYGDAAGCPQQETSTSGNCNNGWTQEGVWYISWGAWPAWPLPEMYNTTGAQAKQWKYLSLYSAKFHGGRMSIAGAFTQWQACQGRSCVGTDNSPSTGWGQLWDQLNSDSRTSQNLQWSTDITWNN